MTLNIPASIDLPMEELLFFKAFLQGQVNRCFVGGLRYGSINKKQKYLTRMKKELKAYIQYGNMEQLLNIAVYCFLEAYAPENKKFHFDNTVESVTRKARSV